MINNFTSIRSLRLANISAVTSYDEALNLSDYNGMDHYERELERTEDALDAIFTMVGDDAPIAH